MFGCCESDLDDYFWRYSFYELTKRIEISVGHSTAVQMANYASLVEVVSSALGGGKDQPKNTNVEDLTQASPEHLAARFAALTSL